MKVAEIKELSTSDLQELIQTEQANYSQLVLNHAVSPLQDNSQIKAARRNIARLQTILRQRELNKQ
ncbi:MAG: 50S ribosomal protein L29 [Bacteroidaceae bacterium]|nr:50S ribosomal protein L29 [Prevotellaceae bacterium]MDY5631183.1 50S ribosomal protein L29 [Bacteroidaceae bacterium]